MSHTICCDDISGSSIISILLALISLEREQETEREQANVIVQSGLVFLVTQVV